MRIGYIINSFPCTSETFIVNDIRGLEALGHEVSAIALAGADPLTVGNPNYEIKGKIIRVKGLGTPLIRKVQKLTARQRLRRRHGAIFEHLYNDKPEIVPEELWTDRLTWDAALEQIDEQRFDFLYVHFAMRQLLLGYHASRLLRIPLAITMQAHDIFVNPLSRFFPHTLGQCAFIVTVSHYNREVILKMAPNLETSRVHVLANGIDVDGFNAAPHDPHKPFRFASTGRLVEIKGFHVLVEAAGILAKKRRDFVVQIVGEGPLREHLERRIEELDIADVFQLLGRHDASFLKEWLPQQDCFALPCVIAKDGNRDGMPLALREGMACGLPALSTQLIGLHETVSPGTGYLVEPDDALALANGMERLMNLSPSEHRTMAQASRKKAETEFSLMHEVKLLERWMEESLRERRTEDSSPAAEITGR
jgi:colanic acid/amylovoran biosynthesis glycosyltransferase